MPRCPDASVAGEPQYVVCKVSPMQSYQKLSVLHSSPELPGSHGLRFDYVDEHEPDALEIQRVEGADHETVWTYSAARAAALAAERKDLVETSASTPCAWGRG